MKDFAAGSSFKSKPKYLVFFPHVVVGERPLKF